MLIKASRITNLTDARYFAAKEVDFLGFNLEEGTEGYLDPMYMKAIREWVEGPKIVGEFSNAPLAYVREAASFFGLDAVQIGAKESNKLADLEGLAILLEVPEGHLSDPSFFRAAAPYASFFLIKANSADMPPPEDVQAGYLQLLKSICAEYPVLLQTDASEAYLVDLLETVRPSGLSIIGGEEEKVGVKSFDEIEAVFEALGR